MLRRALVTLLCCFSIIGTLSVIPISASNPLFTSAVGTATDFLLRILLIPFLVSLALVISCDARKSVGWAPFAVGPLLSFLISGTLFSWQQVAFCLVSVCCSVAGWRIVAAKNFIRGF